MREMLQEPTTQTVLGILAVKEERREKGLATIPLKIRRNKTSDSIINWDKGLVKTGSSL